MTQYPPPSWEAPQPEGPPPPAWGAEQQPDWGVQQGWGGQQQAGWEATPGWSPGGQGWNVPPPPAGAGQAPREPFLLRKAVLVPLTAVVAFVCGYAVSSAVTTVEALRPALDDFQQTIESADAPDPVGPQDGEGGSITETLSEGGLQFSDIRVYPDFADDFTVSTTVENTTDETVDANVAAFVLNGGDRVGETSTFVSLQPGDSTEIELTGFDDYSDDWDGIEFEVDAA